MPSPAYPFASRSRSRGDSLLGGGLPVLFDWNIEAAAAVPDGATSARASVSQVQTTTTGGGVWWQQIDNDEPPIDGARRVKNLLDSSNGTGPFTSINEEGRICVHVTASNGTLTITIGGVPQVFGPTATPQPFAAFDDVTGTTTITIAGTATLSEPMAHLVQPGNDIPEPYVAHDQDPQNLGVNGRRYFATANNSTVDGDGVVTFIVGASLTSIRPNPGLTGLSVPDGLAIVGGVSNVDLSNPVIAPTSVFVRTTGNDGNDGLSVGQAVRTVDKGLEIIATTGANDDPFQLDIGSGRWYQSEVFPTAPVSGNFPNRRNIEIIGAGKTQTILANAEDPSGVVWSDNADGTYTATVTDASHAADLGTLDGFGNPTSLTEVADLTALLAASEGFFVVGSDIRVKPLRAGSPDSDLLVFLTSNNAINSTRNKLMYLHDLSWIGFSFDIRPSAPLGTVEPWKWLFEDMLFGYTTGNVGSATLAMLWGAAVSSARYYLKNVDIAFSANDGANYSADLFAVEEACNFYNSGWLDRLATNRQNSTGHNRSQVMRVTSVYNPIAGASSNIADVNDGTKAWIYNCVVNEIDLSYGGWVDTVDGAKFQTPGTFGYFFSNVTNIQAPAPTSDVFFPKNRPGWRGEQGGQGLVTDSYLPSQWLSTGTVTITDVGVQNIGLKGGFTAEADGTGSHNFRPNSTVNYVGGTTYTATFIIQAETTDRILMRCPLSDTTFAWVNFDIVNGLVNSQSASIIDASMEWLGDNWHFGWSAWDVDTTSAANRTQFGFTDVLTVPAESTSGPPTYTASAERVRFVHHNVDDAASPTSPIISLSGAATRQAESDFDTGVAAPNTGFTAFADASAPIKYDIDAVGIISIGVANAYLGARIDGDQYALGGGVNIRIDSNNWIDRFRTKASGSSPNDGLGGTSYLSTTGETTGPDTNTSILSGTFKLGQRQNVGFFNGRIHRATIYDTAASQEENERLVQ